MGASMSTPQTHLDSTPTPKIQESETPEEIPNSKESENPVQETQQEGGEEEEVGECPFCLFMKAGECKDTFLEWEKCVLEAEENKEDILDKCAKATSAMMECMKAHPDHYGRILKAGEEIDESKGEEKAITDVEKEQAVGEGAKEAVREVKSES